MGEPGCSFWVSDRGSQRSMEYTTVMLLQEPPSPGLLPIRLALCPMTGGIKYPQRPLFVQQTNQLARYTREGSPLQTGALPGGAASSGATAKFAMPCPAVGGFQAMRVCPGPRPAGLTELSWCWKACKGSIADGRGGAASAGSAAQLCLLWQEMELFMASDKSAAFERDRGPLLRKVIGECCIFVLLFFLVLGHRGGLPEGSVAWRLGHMVAVFTHETWIYYMGLP